MSTATALNGTQKAAVVLMNLPPESAAEVLKQFSDAEAEEIAAEIIRLRRVDADTAQSAVEEFHTMAISGKVSARGGEDVANALLYAAFGAEGAQGLLGRVANSLAGKDFEFLGDIDPGQIVALLDAELPQTSALVLAHLNPTLASKVLMGLDDETRTEIARRIAVMTAATPEAVALVASALKQRAHAVLKLHQVADTLGGVQSVVDIINRTDVKTERAVLTGLEIKDPQLAEEVRARMLTFADIVKFDPRDVQQVLRGTDTNVLAIAMKGAPEAVVNTIRNNLSEHNREVLDEELAALGPVRASQVDEARATVVRAIRELEASGGITVYRSADEDKFVD